MAKKTATAPKDTLVPLKSNLPAVVQTPTGAGQDPEGPEHPYRMLDRASRAAVARMTGGVSPHSIFAAWSDWAMHLSRSPGRQLELAEHAAQNAGKLANFAQNPAGEAPFKPSDYDHRFTDQSWAKLPFALYAQGFLAMQDWWNAATDDMPGFSKSDAERTRFQMRQTLDLVSPSNFPWLNPQIIQETARTGGVNLIEGAAHFTEDMIQTLTQTHKRPPEGFQIGKDLACTKGKVVYRNDLFELIQYSPTTKDVHAQPLLIVPAWIMKYYILDLSAHNSMVKYLVDQGFTVFMISWCNPDADQAELCLEDYRIKGVMAALDAIGGIVPDQKIHTMGYCLGGTLLSITAATMARDGDDRLATVTLLAAQVDFDEAGELLLFVDESQVAFIEDLMWTQGYLDRPQMTRTFATIRAEDLIYTRAVNRYFLGKDDLPSDILVWNNDTTRMPARMHSEYLRGLFLENRLTAGRFAVEGRVIALKDISAPMFVVGTETDHIAPWRSVYKARLFTDHELTFVLTNGGHNGGILSEPGHKHRHYRVGLRVPDQHYQGPDEWLEHHAPIEGSWWPEFAGWLAAHSEGKGAPPAMGKALCDAPGTYVYPE